MTVQEEKLSRFRLGGFTGLLSLYFQQYFIKAPLLFIVSSFTEIGMIFLLTIIGSLNYLPVAIAGSLISGTFLIGSGQFPVELRNANQTKFRNMVIASPVNPIAFVLAVSIGSGIHLIIQLLILSLILLFLVHLTVVSIIQIMIDLSILWILGAAFGYLMSIRNVSNARLRMTTQILRIFFIIFSPIYYPIIKLPYFLQIIALFLPTTNAAIILQNIINIQGILSLSAPDIVNGTSLLINWLILLFWAVIILFIAIKSGRWEDN